MTHSVSGREQPGEGGGAVDDERLSEVTAAAILGVDTLFGGDVLSRSGTGRFIADSWFSDRPLPEAYSHPAAAALRACGGVTGRPGDAAERDAALDAYLAAVDVPAAVAGVARAAEGLGGLRGGYLSGLAQALGVMWELALEVAGRGPAVPFARCVEASTGAPPTPSAPEERLEEVAELLSGEGHGVGTREELVAAVDAWRAARLLPRPTLRLVADALVARLDAGTARHLVPHLPAALRDIPRANVEFEVIADAWFSGSMNYYGRARDAAGRPLYEAGYEINAALEISIPELAGLVAHEVVPGHVTTFALLQALHGLGAVPFEATVLTMNTRGAALSEGIANNALLMALGVTALEDLPDDDLQLGALLALLQDDAKNQASWLTWGEGAPREQVAAVLRRDFLCSPERADKLSGAWGGHPLLGRMYLPCYRAGTEKVAALLRSHPPAVLFPVLYGAAGLVDVVTIDAALAAAGERGAQ